MNIFSKQLSLHELIECRLRKQKNVPQLSKSCDDIFSKLIQEGVSSDDLYNHVCQQVCFQQLSYAVWEVR